MAEALLFPRLFEPARIGKVRLKNRLVMLPLGTAYGTPSGEVSQQTIDYYSERAKGGVGMITVGNVSPYLPNSPHQLALDSDAMLKGHYELAEKVHACGAKITAQLNHPGKLKYAVALALGEERISSSAIPGMFMGQALPVPRALSRDEIYQWVERYVRAAARAKQVGYDMIELHAAHGVLINQFISPFMNNRTDEFGGSLENRMRFPLEMLKAIRREVGTDFPVGIRISAEEFVPGGITPEQSPAIARMLESAGVAYISASAGVFETAHKMIGLMRDSEGWKEYLWSAIKKAVAVPVIAGGDLKHPDFCEKVLERGNADFIGLGRPLTADPEWPTKAREGRLEDIRPCISCNECIYGSASRRRGGGARRCSVNAANGREREFSVLVPATKPKRVMVIGGGPGGMEAARIAALRCHHVALYEKGQSLGGQLLVAGKLKSKSKMLWLCDYFTAQLHKLGVEVNLGTEVTPALVENAMPDVVVVAAGAQPLVPDVPGITNRNVVSAWDVLLGKVRLEKASVAVIGGNAVGCDVTEHLLEMGNRVTIVKRKPALAPDMEPHHRLGMLELLEGNPGVTVLTGRTLAGLTERGARVVNLESGQEELLEADWVVIAMGSMPADALIDSLEGKVPELYCVGDCNTPRVIMEAVYEGSLVGRQI